MSSTPTFGRRTISPQPAGGWSPPPVRSVAPGPSTVETPAFDKTPYLSIGLLTLLALIFIFQPTGGLPMGPGMELSVHNLVADGGVSRDLVMGGEWWRILTAPLLHANLAHIVGNAVVMTFAAIALERVVGRAWLAAAFVVSAIGGSTASLLMNDPKIVSVGASGAIMGLLAMIMVCSFHPSMHENAKRLRWITARLFVPSLIPFGAAQGSTTDYNGHLGGAVAGGVLGFILLATWAEDSDHPRPHRLLAIFSGVGLALSVTAFALVATRHEVYIARGRPLVPDFMMPRKGWASEQQAMALVEAYPRDPRARLQLAHIYLNADNVVSAEREARAGLAERAILARDVPDGVEPMLRFHLVGALLKQQRWQAAASEARPLCLNPSPDKDLKEAYDSLRASGVCDHT